MLASLFRFPFQDAGDVPRHYQACLLGFQNIERCFLPLTIVSEYVFYCRRARYSKCFNHSILYLSYSPNSFAFLNLISI